MNVRVLGSIKHNGVRLEPYEVYDIPEKTAKGWIENGVAQEVSSEKKGEPEPAPVKREEKPVESYVGEAEIDPAKRAQLEAEGKLNDSKPVVEPPKEQDPEEVVVIEGDNPPDDTVIGKQE